MIITPGIEPSAAPWQARAIRDVGADLVTMAGTPPNRPRIAAVDGRSGSGKSTFAARLAATVPGATVIHTDDVAWWESFFGWDQLMADGILRPVRRAQAVRYRPPAWDRRNRPGAIEVPAGSHLVIVEGVGASRRALAPLIDATVWVQSDLGAARHRGIQRDGATREAEEFWDEWDRAELPFLVEDRPWERADLVVCGTPDHTGVTHDPSVEVVVGRSLRV